MNDGDGKTEYEYVEEQAHGGKGYRVRIVIIAERIHSVWIPGCGDRIGAQELGLYGRELVCFPLGDSYLL